jgi:hypothetical protein
MLIGTLLAICGAVAVGVLAVVVLAFAAFGLGGVGRRGQSWLCRGSYNAHGKVG